MRRDSITGRKIFRQGTTFRNISIKGDFHGTADLEIRPSFFGPWEPTGIRHVQHEQGSRFRGTFEEHDVALAQSCPFARMVSSLANYVRLYGTPEGLCWRLIEVDP